MTAAWAYLMRTGTLIRSRIAAWLRLIPDSRDPDYGLGRLLAPRPIKARSVQCDRNVQSVQLVDLLWRGIGRPADDTHHRSVAPRSRDVSLAGHHAFPPRHRPTLEVHAVEIGIRHHAAIHLLPAGSLKPSDSRHIPLADGAYLYPADHKAILAPNVFARRPGSRSSTETHRLPPMNAYRIQWRDERR